MEAEKQHRKLHSVVIKSKKENGSFNFVNNTPRGITQTKLIENIQNGDREKLPLQQKKKISNASQNATIQRLIVVDNDMDSSRLIAAVSILKKHERERITTIAKASSLEINQNEKIYLVAHGTEISHGDRSAEDLARIILGWRLHPGENTVKLISCFTGKDAPEWSYSNELALQLGFKYKVVGIKGLEGTDDRGHTRATKILSEKEKFDAVYDGILEGDTSFQEAETIAKEAKNAIDGCRIGEENKIMLDAYAKISSLCKNVLDKLDVALKGMIEEKSKKDSEDIMSPLV